MTVTDVSRTCAVVIFRVKVSCITSVEGIILWLLTLVIDTLVIDLSITSSILSHCQQLNNPIQDYVHPEDQTQPTFEMTLGFKPLTMK